MCSRGDLVSVLPRSSCQTLQPMDPLNLLVGAAARLVLFLPSPRCSGGDHCGGRGVYELVGRNSRVSETTDGR